MKVSKKKEFKKQLAAIAVGLILGITIGVFVLAAFGLTVPEMYTSAIVGSAFAYLVTYAASSAVEKNSRNKYGIDVNGIPYSVNQTQAVAGDSTSDMNQGG